jgi:hypothetical protein
MEHLSTTMLASVLDISRDDLFQKLKDLGLIDRKNNKWILTKLGEQKGGQIRKTPGGEEYIVWPDNLNIDDRGKENSTKLLNATAIGKHFNVSNQRINLILSELGFQENDIAGWEITKLGRNLGGKQCQIEQSGKLYVLWPQSILTNKNLNQIFNLNIPEKNQETKLSPADKSELSPSTDNFRHKYPASMRAQDGHFVRSKSELIIDNWLYISGLVHSYEKKLPIDEDVVSDFYIPSGNGRPQAVYIEYWGLENDPKYQERMKKKIEIYKKYEFPLIQLTDKEIENIDDELPRRLLQYKIKVSG